MRNARRIWALVCFGAAVAGALVYGLPEGDYMGFSLFAASVFLVILLFIWLPGVLVLLALELLYRAYQRVRT